MQRSEELMSKYPELNFHFDKSFPTMNGAIILDNDIYLNPAMTESNQVGILAEEIGHAKTSSGDIVDYNQPRNWRQELDARRWGYQHAVPLSGIIDAFKDTVTSFDELADYFDVTQEYLDKAVQYYHEKYGLSTIVNDYQITFDPSLSVKKM